MPAPYVIRNFENCSPPRIDELDEKLLTYEDCDECASSYSERPPSEPEYPGGPS